MSIPAFKPKVRTIGVYDSYARALAALGWYDPRRALGYFVVELTAKEREKWPGKGWALRG